MEEDCYFSLEDKIWYDRSIINLYSIKKFDHPVNFQNLMLLTEYNNKSIKIVEGFFISDNLNELFKNSIL